MKIPRFPILELEFPRSVDVLVFDEVASEPIMEDISSLGLSFDTIEARGLRVNFWALLRALSRLPMSKEALWRKYLDVRVELANPMILISLIDNNQDFWQLGARFPTVRSVAVQNGWRSKAFDVFEQEHNPKDGLLSDLFCFNASVGDYYKEHVSVKRVHVVGSYRSNRVPVTGALIELGALWISQYSPTLPVNSAGVSPGQFMLSEATGVVTFLNWASSRGIKGAVLGRHTGLMARAEEAWFEELLPGVGFTFVEKSQEFGSSYFLVDKAKIIGTCDSTLGYEALARGRPVFFFSSRPTHADLQDWRFGWPDMLPDEGPFWSIGDDRGQIFVKLDKLAGDHGTDAAESFGGVSRFMERDEKNSELLGLIAKTAMNSRRFIER